MKRLEVCVAVMLALLASACLAAEQTLPTETLARQKQVQQRVRSMARELVGNVLDIQLRQLRENGLEGHQLYSEIQAMRKDLDKLIDREMPEVIKLLTDLEMARTEDPKKTFEQTRNKSRDIVVALYVQRQNLLRRLKIAEMAAQVRQLIQMESNVLSATESLPQQQPQARRETLTLAAVEDQRDVRTVYDRFVDELAEISRWTGPFGAEAAEGLRALDQAKVRDSLRSAEEHLLATKYAEAATEQRAVIKALQALLQRIEQAQGLAEADRNYAADRLRELMAQQEKLREATKQARLDQPEQQKQLIDEQTRIRKEIGTLRDSLQDVPAAQQPLEAAQRAALEAAREMTEENPSGALAQQDNVLKSLEKAAAAADALRDWEGGLTAEQYQKRLSDLQAAREDLRRVEAEQQRASEKVADKPVEAKGHETQVAKELEKIPQGRDLPEPVKSRMAEARQAAAEAAAEMGRPLAERKAAVEAADRAVERAVAETEAALADAQRDRLLTKISELAHAARALDQAAETERQISKHTNEASQQQGLEAEQAKQMAEAQQDVGQIAKKVAEGVKQTVPEAAKTLAEAAKPIAAAEKQLQAAAEQPGEPSKKPAARASEAAAKAAEQLEQAAEQIRGEMRRALAQLEQVGGQQLAKVEQSGQEVGRELAKAVDSLADRLQRLAEAQEKVAQAQADQQRAAGRPEKARAMELAEKIRKALEQQTEADRAAEALERTRSGDTRQAVAKQEQVAKTVGEIAREAGQPAAQPAGQEQSGQQQSDEKPHGGEKPQPGQQAQSGEKPQAGEKPQSGEPSQPGGQPQGGEKPQPGQQAPADQQHGAEQGQTDQQPLGELGKALAKAEQAAQRAAEALDRGGQDEARQARQQVREALEEAQKLARGAEQAAETARQGKPEGKPDASAQKRVTEAARQAAELARQDAPQAAGALDQAEKTSQQAEAALGAGKPQQAADQQEATGKSLEEAAQQLQQAAQKLREQAAQRLAQMSRQAGQMAAQNVPVDPGATSALRGAEQQAQQGATPQATPQQAQQAEQGAQQAMAEAAASLAARGQEIANDIALGRAIAQAGEKPLPASQMASAQGQQAGSR